jgi:glycosyltransferase involved in cell wall biosynthesis
MNVSLVIPVYNAAATLRELRREIDITFDRLGMGYELVLVDDGSQDDSWHILQDMKALDPERVRPIELMRNYGQHNALLCGIRAARYPIVVTVDDDLQNPPSEIPKLLNALEQGYDVVYGWSSQRQHGLWRNAAARITYAALRSAMGTDIAHRVSAFRAFRTKVRDAFRDFQGPFVSVDVLLTWGTTRFTSVEVRLDPRQSGESGYTVRKLVSHAVNMLTGFSVLPLQMASLAGFSVMLFGLGILVYVGVRTWLEGSPPGFPFLASIIAIFSGVQLFSLGVIGEYLARMHFRIMARPAYTMREPPLVGEPVGPAERQSHPFHA